MPPHSTHSTLLAQPSSRLCYHIEQKGAGGEEEITPLQSFPAAVTAQNKLVNTSVLMGENEEGGKYKAGKYSCQGKDLSHPGGSELLQGGRNPRKQRAGKADLMAQTAPLQKQDSSGSCEHTVSVRGTNPATASTALTAN